MTDARQRLAAELAGRYAIERELGAGGMATVYLARDLKHDRDVALKVLRPELAAAIGAERFFAEIRTTANLQHPHILPLHDSGDAGGLLYYVMPFVPGESLRARLERDGPLPTHEVATILREVADALGHAHERGIVHRDIKPDNILISGRHVLVSDFGVAKAVSGAASSSPLTSAGISLGTPSYMAPEQVAADPGVDHRADLYALGAMGYELLTGRPPFTGDTPQAVLAAHLTQPPTPLQQLVPDVPPTVAAVIMRCLEKKAADRWLRADDVVSALAPFVTPAAGTVMSGRRRGSSRGRKTVTVAGAVGAVALLLGGWFFARGGGARGGPVDPRIVAVVPLTTIGGDESTRAFADGLVEVLASRLTELSRFADAPIWVIPPGEIRDLEITSAAKARAELGATLAMTGSLQPAPQGVRLTLNLIDAATLRQLRSTVLMAPMSDAGTWQDGAVEQALVMLDLEPQSGGEWEASAEGGTQVATAYELFVKGRGYLQRHNMTEQDIDAAIGLFARALAEDSAYALATAGMGEAYWLKYRRTRDTAWVEEAMTFSQRALALSDSLPQVWTTLAIIDNGMGQSEDAMASATRALEMDPFATDAYLELATAHQNLQQFDQAERALQELIDRRPYYWKAYSRFAFLRYVQGRYPDAAAMYARAGELAPGNASVYRNAGAIYFFLDRWDEARTMFARSTEAEPNAGAVSNTGTIDYYEGNYEAAAERFREAIALRERDFIYWRNLGDALGQMEGREAEAKAAYQQSLELARAEQRVNPSDATMLQNLAFVYAMLGRRDEALALVDQLAPDAGDDADLMVLLAQTLEEVGERDRALDWMREAVARDYSLKIIESEPQLAGLRADPRFASIRQDAPARAQGR